MTSLGPVGPRSPVWGLPQLGPPFKATASTALLRNEMELAMNGPQIVEEIATLIEETLQEAGVTIRRQTAVYVAGNVVARLGGLALEVDLEADSGGGGAEQ